MAYVFQKGSGDGSSKAKGTTAGGAAGPEGEDVEEDEVATESGDDNNVSDDEVEGSNAGMSLEIFTYYYVHNVQELGNYKKIAVASVTVWRCIFALANILRSHLARFARAHFALTKI